MNILFLVNPALKYKQFFGPLAQQLTNSGHQVFFAGESCKGVYVDPQAFIDENPNTFYLDKFAKNYYYEKRLSIFERYNWGELFFSDIDRFVTDDYNHHDVEHYYYLAHLVTDFLSSVMDQNKIDVVLYENVSNSYEKIASDLCQDRNIRYLGLISSRIPGYFEIQQHYLTVSNDIASMYMQQEASIEELQWVEDYIAHIESIEPDYMKQNGADIVRFTHFFFNRGRLVRLKGLIQAELKVVDIPYQRKTLLRAVLGYMRTSVTRYIKSKIIKRFYSKPSDTDSEFFLYPTHFHPESSTSVLAPNYVDEYNNILNIAMSLPLGSLLYVKDHKSGFASYPYWFYKKVIMIPNVRLIAPYEHTKKLVKKSKAVITVNSTVGYEAVLMSKPVFLLGKAFYEQFEGVILVPSFVQLPKLIKEFNGYNFNWLKNQQWIVAYKRYCFKGVLNLSQAPSQTVFTSIERYLSKND